MLCLVQVFNDDDRCGQVSIEMLEVITELFQLGLQVNLLMVELNYRVLFHVPDDLSG